MEFTGGSGSNTYNLYSHGWNGLLLDISNENISINLHKHEVTPSNVVSILEQYQIPLEPDYLSIDIDSLDLWVLRSIISSQLYRPRVISVEFNPNFPLSISVTVPPTSLGNTGVVDLLFGASAGAIKLVAEEFGYAVVHVINKLDLILIRRDILGSLCERPFFLHYFKRTQVQECIRDPNRMFQWIEYKAWRETNGNIEFARTAAVEQIVLNMEANSPAKSTIDNRLKCFGIDFQQDLRIVTVGNNEAKDL
jgi:hypothetical protein